MTATDELRRLLDGRGVEWRQSTNTIGCVWTYWESPLFGAEVCAMDNDDEMLVMFDEYYLTPAQAVEATLGRSGCVYVLTAIDPGDGREYTLGIYATKELAEKSAETDGRGYVLHDVSRWEVVDA